MIPLCGGLIPLCGGMVGRLRQEGSTVQPEGSTLRQNPSTVQREGSTVRREDPANAFAPGGARSKAQGLRCRQVGGRVHFVSPPIMVKMRSVTVFSSASISARGRGGWKT